MSSAAATACTCTPRCRLRRTAASLNSALYSWTFFGPARGTRHLPLLGGSVYKSEAGSPVNFKRLLDGAPPRGEAGPWCGGAAPIEPDKQGDAEGQGAQKRQSDKPWPLNWTERPLGEEICKQEGGHQ